MEIKEELSAGLCRCCLEAGMYRSVFNSLTCTGDSSETYAEMVFICFSMNVMNADVKEEENFICDICILRLKDAFMFRAQIEEAQKDLEQRLSFDDHKIMQLTEIADELEDRTHEADADLNWNLEYLDEYEDVVAISKPVKPKVKRKKYRTTAKPTKAKGRGWTSEKKVDDKLFERSLLTHICRVKLQCLICMERFQNMHVLTQHINVHYPNYICDTCGKAFASKRRIMAHSRVHEKCDYQCEECNLSFNTKCKWQNHIAKHKQTNRYRCTECPERFKDFFQREKHLVSVHGKVKNAYQCSQCESTFGTAGHLSAHVRRVHLQERNKICSTCGMSFFSGIELAHHMVSHTGERSHACEVCNKSYPRLKTLKEHMKIHTNEKRFICSVCERSFTQKCTLKAHMKTHGCALDSFIETKKVESSGKILIYMAIINNGTDTKV